MLKPGNDAALTAAAFGSEPGTWPLPAAATPHQLWLRAVAAGGQGRFASARADLAALLGSVPAGPLASPGSLVSLAHSTRASFLRQLGWHSLARGCDGRALAHAGDDPETFEARADALIGLAADALGVGRFAASAALLARAAEVPDPATTPAYRLAVRRAWVTAELAMATGDGATAVRQAQQALELNTGSGRHRVKSDMVLASALCCDGNVDRARAVADGALDDAAASGLVPLQWALASLLIDVGSSTRTPGEVRDIRDGCAELVRHRGGEWRDPGQR